MRNISRASGLLSKMDDENTSQKKNESIGDNNRVKNGKVMSAIKTLRISPQLTQRAENRFKRNISQNSSGIRTNNITAEFQFNSVNTLKTERGINIIQPSLHNLYHYQSGKQPLNRVYNLPMK